MGRSSRGFTMSNINSHTGRVLPDLSTHEPTYEQLMEMVRALQDKVNASPAPRKATFKVSDKGCLSVNHGSRFPTTLYRSQWMTIIAAVHDGSLEAFIKTNAARLPMKGE